MFRILIVRHGDPDYENDCLTPQGKKDVLLLAKRLERERIDEIYSSPFGRAKQTAAATAENKKMIFEILDFLHEFIGKVLLSDGRSVFPWKVPGDFYSKNFSEFNREGFEKNEILFDEEFRLRFENTKISLDSFLRKFGFKRVYGGYKNDNDIDKTVAFFCHNGLGVLLLSLICGFPVMQMWQHVFMNTSSVTEIDFVRSGDIIYPICTLMGDNSHLMAPDNNFIAEI